MEKITCWRCGKHDQLRGEPCQGCGVKDPASKNATHAASNVSSADGRFVVPPKPLLDGHGDFATHSSVNRFQNRSPYSYLANRLRREARMAANYFYVLAWVATGVGAVLMIGVLFMHVDFWVKLAFGGQILGAVVAVWLAVMLTVPFYTYMQLRGIDYENRDS